MEPIDVQGSGLFLRQQAATLTCALLDPDDPSTLRDACAAHEGSHDRWVGLVAATRERSADAADAVADLYTFHGRLLESLEHGLEGWFHPQAASDIREVLADRLARRTDAVVGALDAMGGRLLDLAADRRAPV